MLICGLKLTHDGGLALIENNGRGNRLIGSLETEKFNNLPRHQDLSSPSLLALMLDSIGVRPSDIDRWVIDGWWMQSDFDGDPLRLVFAGAVMADGIAIPHAPYVHLDDDTKELHTYTGTARLAGHLAAYESYRHVEGHLASAVATCPARQEGKPVAVLVWDGGMFPQVYVVGTAVTWLYHLFPVRGRSFEAFAQNIDPFIPDPSWDNERLNRFMDAVPGKAMAYAGLGQSHPEMVNSIRHNWPGIFDTPDEPERLYGLVAPFANELGLDNASLFASFQQAVGEILVERLFQIRARLPDDLCFVGGNALNIKWNSAIRDSQLFDSVWVPPFPNDSGSAIGTACASIMARGDFRPLTWDVYSGAALPLHEDLPDGWRSTPCKLDRLAMILDTDQPVTVVSRRAELGPRALGHRSILASPQSSGMKALLNDVKGRESYRPVAPMCLEEDAPTIFDPGTPDPYMLFDHKVRPEWVDRVPAVLHLDGTARLQTVAPGCLAYEIVSAYKRLTGIPVLCNTSANHPGKGFFPNVRSALEWGGTPYVWSNGRLYERGPCVTP